MERVWTPLLVTEGTRAFLDLALPSFDMPNSRKAGSKARMLSFPFRQDCLRCVLRNARFQICNDTLRRNSSTGVEAYAFSNQLSPLCLNSFASLCKTSVLLTHPPESVQGPVSSNDAVSWHRIASVGICAHELTNGPRTRCSSSSHCSVSRDAAWWDAFHQGIDQLAFS